MKRAFGFMATALVILMAFGSASVCRTWGRS